MPRTGTRQSLLMFTYPRNLYTNHCHKVYNNDNVLPS